MASKIDLPALKRFRGFQRLNDQEVGDVAALLEPVHLIPGQILFRQGDPGDALYLLVSGQIEVQIKVPDRPDHVATSLDSGAIFGEISPLLNEPRTATVVATSRVDLWRMTRTSIQAALDRGDRWATKFLLATVQGLARRLVALNHEVIALTGGMRS